MLYNMKKVMLIACYCAKWFVAIALEDLADIACSWAKSGECHIGRPPHEQLPPMFMWFSLLLAVLFMLLLLNVHSSLLLRSGRRPRSCIK